MEMTNERILKAANDFFDKDCIEKTFWIEGAKWVVSVIELSEAIKDKSPNVAGNP